MKLKELFAIESKPKKGLFALEWIVMAYLLLTTVVIFFIFTRVHNPEAMLWGRLKIVAMTLLLWGVYRLLPCQLTRMARVAAQMALLSWWYPDTYEINRVFPNLDHLFASWEQSLFGCQPALHFSEVMPWPVVSELMDMGYAAYYPMIAAVVLFYFFQRQKEWMKAAYIVMGAFFIYYVIFIFLPVTGPQFYYAAVGIDQIASGVFPNIGDYFNTHQDCLASPGYTDGLFYQLVEDAKNAGERPTAAFPSSHVGISTVLMWLAWQSRCRRLFFILLPLYVFLCMATVYIQAHYLIDAIAGFITGTAFYWLMKFTYRGRIANE